MPKPLPRRLIVECDSREKLPLLFPLHLRLPADPSGKTFKSVPIQAVRTKLDSGDYRLKNYPKVCVIERKKGQSELIQNLLTKDYHRAHASLERLAKSCSHPTLLIESSPNVLLKPAPVYPSTSKYKKSVDPSYMLHRLSSVLGELGIGLLMAGDPRSSSQRRNLARFALHYMVGLAFPKILGIST